MSASLAGSVVAGAADTLEYDRSAVAGGQVWRLLTGQLVHWTPRMALIDLTVLLAFGAWVEHGSRRTLVVALAGAAASAAAGLHLLAPEIAFYRGSSGLGVAVFSACALKAALDEQGGWVRRGVGLTAILLLGVKTIWETRAGVVLAAGRMPDGVEVTPIVHLLGGLAGLGAALALRRPGAAR